MTDESSPARNARDRWEADRTTFQRVYDVLAGTTEPTTAQQFADRASCSENGARQALEQLVEMGIATQSGERPVRYRRNQSYFRWKRVETLAREHDPTDLRERLDDLLETDRAFQDAYGVPAPDAVVVTDESVDDHDAIHDRWDDLTEWRTVRRDLTLVQRALQRAESFGDDRVQV
ncbi:DUF7342 family protein [Natronoglomus mannanivorans]|uniref:Sugar-specific transcriptional regulator TrmB n=1 Tax=Natronoglomus mannanivorans TaxID=2979990 RepID=A0AAP2YW20_9EURY|nr:hypothetical protein [Halobacteria archaeon AArc-xg1-1]